MKTIALIALILGLTACGKNPSKDTNYGGYYGQCLPKSYVIQNCVQDHIDEIEYTAQRPITEAEYNYWTGRCEEQYSYLSDDHSCNDYQGGNQ